MAGGLLALLDDVALIARSAAASVDDVAAMAGKTSMKAAGVVVDDAAVTPQYVTGVDPKRELPMIWKITKGSLVNKLCIILPVAMLLSWLASWALSPILMCGGSFLCYEGAHKIVHKLLPHDEKEDSHKNETATDKGPEAEEKLVKSAIRTDLILSSEIMVISLNSILDQSFGMRVAILIAVAIALTLGVYGAVGLLVKIDDIGMHMIKRNDGESAVGSALVKGMPYVLNVIGVVGTAAMLWVGGHIIIEGLHDFNINAPYNFLHRMSEMVPAGFLAWLVDTIVAMIFGLIVGLIIVGIVTAISSMFGSKTEKESAQKADA